jgi:hypothetical protein
MMSNLRNAKNARAFDVDDILSVASVCRHTHTHSHSTLLNRTHLSNHFFSMLGQEVLPDRVAAQKHPENI